MIQFSHRTVRDVCYGVERGAHLAERIAHDVRKKDHGQYLTEGLKSLVAITEMPKGAHSNRFEQINIQINTQI